MAEPAPTQCYIRAYPNGHTIRRYGPFRDEDEAYAYAESHSRYWFQGYDIISLLPPEDIER